MCADVSGAMYNVCLMDCARRIIYALWMAYTMRLWCDLLYTICNYTRKHAYWRIIYAKMAGVYYTFAVAPFIRESGILAYKIRLENKNTIFRQAYFIRYIDVSTFA